MSEHRSPTDLLTGLIRGVARRLEPSDPAAMFTFLASRASSWIIGQTHPVKGGFSVSQ